jgi:hypothetical protein
MLGQWLPKACATVAQCLGNGCPMLGQWLPKAWATCAQGLGNTCPLIWQRLPNTWATVAQWLGNGCPRPGQRLHNAWAMVAQCFGNGCTMLGQRLPNDWAMVAQWLGNGCPRLAQRLPKALATVWPPVADQPSHSFKSDPGAITGFGIRSRPPVRRRSHGAQKSRALCTRKQREHEGYYDGAALSGLGRLPSSPREAVCETNM